MLKFDDLGATIDSVWRKANYDEDLFPDLATSALIDSGLLRSVTREDIENWFLSGARIPRQKMRAFGQPPLNLFLSHNFKIEALYWFNSTTDIHQHSFSGAFGVLAGSSVHSKYVFEFRNRIFSRMALGDLAFVSSELLAPGDVRAIVAGQQFIHSLFHLEHPSISIVVRTLNEQDRTPQFSYLKPGIAIDPAYHPDPQITRLHLLEALAKTGAEPFFKGAQSALRSSDFWMAFKVLSVCPEPFRRLEEWQEMVREARRHHGPRVDQLLASLRETSRMQTIMRARQAVRDRDQRFFMALLLNVPNRRTIYELVSRQFPGDDPATLVLRWIDELSEIMPGGMSLAPTSYDNLAGLLRSEAASQQTEPACSAPLDSAVARPPFEILSDSSVLQPLFR